MGLATNGGLWYANTLSDAEIPGAREGATERNERGTVGTRCVPQPHARAWRTLHPAQG